MENTTARQTILVTGGTGFLGAHTILQLLTKGYTVKTTVRSLERQNEVIEMLKAGGISVFDRLTFVETDLTNDANWDKALRNCDYVLHVASPFPGREPKDENELIIPAREGVLRVLKFAREAHVKRVVMTSSFAAIGYSVNPRNHTFTEMDWTDANAKVAAYVKSKTVAERAAWEFIRGEGGGLELTVINPVGIFGPVLGKDFSSSIQLVARILSGNMPKIPKLHFGVVDVRDVADAHIKAMTHPDATGQRFLVAADGPGSLPEIAKILHSRYPGRQPAISTQVLPDWMVKLTAIFKPELKAVSTQLGPAKTLSNQKAKSMLQWTPRKRETTIEETADSLLKFGIIK
jgi:nucleoside-diphosphate-sugar epimerase